jgi:methylmalonyl-CoA mutase N-terminal domain/subunit
MKERFQAKNPKSMTFRFHTQTGGSTLTAQQPENNVTRVTLQALAAVLGGTQSLHTNSRDEALSLPTEESVRIALRTQQIIGYESGVASTIDPLAGSYYVEYLTDEIEKRAMAYIDEIDAIGGALAAIEAGYTQKEIQDASYQYQLAIEDNSSVVVGLNKFQVEDTHHLNILKVNPAVEQSQRAKLAALRENRDNDRSVELLGHLETAARGDENLMPIFVACVENELTLGEICGVLRKVWGEYQPGETF